MSLRNQKILQQFANVSADRLLQSNGMGLINVDNSILARANGGLGINAADLLALANNVIKVNPSGTAFQIQSILPIAAGNSSSSLPCFTNPADATKLISRLQYNFDGTWNGSLTISNIFNDVPINCTVVINWSFTGLQINGSRGASAFNYNGVTQFRQVAAGTLAKIGATNYNLISNDTGDTFTTVPDLIAASATVNLTRALTTTKTFETYFTAEVKILR